MMQTSTDGNVPEPSALSLSDVSAGYGGGLVLRNLCLSVPQGNVVALLGPNGIGKTTLLRVASGLLRPVAGTVHIGKYDVTSQPPHKRRRAGLCLVPEGRGIFPNLSVRDNFLVQVRRRQRNESIDRVLALFPDLSQRLGQVAGSMSGGQQQMLALARCYLSESSVVLVDEASMGLAPIIVDQVYEALGGMRQEGRSLLIVEQYVDRALELADLVYVIGRDGRERMLGAPTDIDRDALMSQYLGAELA